MRAAAPPAPTRNAISAWASVYGRLDKEVDKWAERLAAGQPPLSAGEQARLRSLITAVQQLQPIGNGEAQVAAAIMDGALEASRASLDASVSRLPNHVVASAVSAADEFGWRNTLNKPGVAAIVNGGVGQMTSDWARLNGELQDRIRLELAQGVALGENPKKVAKRLHKTLDGTMSMGQARSVVISRTVMAAAYDQATLDVYRQAAQEGLVAGWEWVTAEDERVCVVCSELNGTLHAVNEPTYKHPSCRCTMIAVDPETAAKRSFNEGYDNLELHTNESGWTSWRKKKDKPVEAPAPPQPPKTVTPDLPQQRYQFGNPDELRWQIDDLYDMYEPEMRDAFDAGDDMFYETAKIWGSDDYKAIQRGLLENDPDVRLPQAGSTVDDFLEVADEAFDRVDPLPFDTQVSRLTREYDDIKELLQSPVGTRIKSDQYIATTVDPLDKLEMAGFGGNVQMEIIIPRGSQVLPVDAATMSGVREAEILINRGSTLELLEEPRKEGSRWIVRLALVG